MTVNAVGNLAQRVRAADGVAQILSLGAESLLTSGKLVELFPDWADELYPLYALYPSRHHRPAKVRAFFEFIVSLAGGALHETAARADRAAWLWGDGSRRAAASR
jgi:DNA-binding transcriptional LysR family regulator